LYPTEFTIRTKAPVSILEIEGMGIAVKST